MKKILTLTTGIIFSANVFSQALIFDGYMDKNSYHGGDTANVYVNANGNYSGVFVKLYDINGNAVDSVMASLQPQTTQDTMAYQNGFGFQISFSYVIPSGLNSGVYLWDNKIPFVVKSSLPQIDILILYESNTEAAYNGNGGKSLYESNSSNNIRAYEVSFLRPARSGIISPFSKSFLQWITGFSGYTIGYICDMDMEDYSEIQNARLLITTGHSEYWTRQARLNFDQFVNSGKNALLLSGNNMWWQIRYSADRTQLICYKDINADTISNPLLKTINWNQASLQFKIFTSIGADYAHGGYGNSPSHGHPGWNGYKIFNPSFPAFQNMTVNIGDTIFITTDEYDGMPITGYDSLGYPIANLAALNFYYFELIGFDLADTIHNGIGSWIYLQKTPSSGKIINVASTDWCSADGIYGQDSVKIKTITSNMIHFLLDIPTYTPENSLAGRENIGVSLFPNPVTSEFTIYHLPFTISKLEIYSVLGEKVYSRQPETRNQQPITVNVSTLTPGIYFVKVRGEKEERVAKFMKQ